MFVPASAAKGRSHRLKFSKEEDENLISLVYSNPCIYDVKHKEYHDTLAKEAIWHNISKDIGKTGSECKIRWKSLKDVYRKRKKEMAETKKPSKWEHLEALKFLDSVTSIRGKSSLAESDDSDRPDNVFMDITEENSEDIILKIEADEETIEEEAENALLDEEARANHHVQINSSFVTKQEPSSSSSSSGQQPEFREGMQMFFDSMARSVMGMPPHLAVKAKMEVLQVISKLELESMANVSGSGMS